MTRRALRKRLGWVASLMSSILIAAAILKLADQPKVYGIVTDLFPLAVAIIAVVVADWLQQRAIFVQSLRALWSRLIAAKTEVTEYIHDPRTPSPERAAAFKALSRAIDEMRGVYRNVGEDARSIGKFPFEPLHDMRRILLAFDAGDVSPEVACQQVEQAWNAFRPAFLGEFNPPEPTEPIVQEGSRDPRRPTGPVCPREHRAPSVRSP